MRLELRTRVYLTFVLIVAIFAIAVAVLGSALIDRTTLAEAQRAVTRDLGSAWSVLDSRLDEMALFVKVLGPGERVARAYKSADPTVARAPLETVRRESGFDFLVLTDAKGRVMLRTVAPYDTGDDLSSDPFVAAALGGKESRGFAVLDATRLRDEGGDFAKRSNIPVEPTLHAKPSPLAAETSAMALVAAAPVRNDKSEIVGAICAGTLLNRNYALVDEIRSIVFKNEMYENRDLGTVTVFLGDVRIATNVLQPNGERAIGTRVSAEVYDRVLAQNSSWYSRAFVVSDWYLTAYEPIHDASGKTVGILYVGVLARKYDDIKWEVWRVFGGVTIAAVIVILIIGFVFARHITIPLHLLNDAARRVGTGDMNTSVPEPSANDEVGDLTRAFNAMMTDLHDREESLKAAYAQLEAANASLQKLNENYLDMLGFVSHELKNTLGVIYTASRSLDIGLVGEMTPTQVRLVRSIVRSCDAAVAMTRNYLDLSRIEKGELRADMRLIDFIPDVIDAVIADLGPAIAQHKAVIDRQFPASVPLVGDSALLRIAYRNLLDNALKYGREGGRIRLGLRQAEGQYLFDVWNEGKGLSPDKLAKLFGKFVRFRDSAETIHKGTGLGLFITREIIAKHGGRIWAESKEGEWMCFTFSLPRPAPATQ